MPQATTLPDWTVTPEKIQYPLPDAIYGFHAQQSCEKLLKALITALGKVYPFTHSVDKLIELLKASGETLPATAFDPGDLEPFAVTLRYDHGVALSETDRQSIRDCVATLREFVVRECWRLRRRGSSFRGRAEEGNSGVSPSAWLGVSRRPSAERKGI